MLWLVEGKSIKGRDAGLSPHYTREHSVSERMREAGGEKGKEQHPAYLQSSHNYEQQ